MKALKIFAAALVAAAGLALPSHAIVTGSYVPAQYSCNGVTTAYGFSFAYAATSDIVVTKTLSATTTTLSTGTDYNITPSASPSAGTVTLTSGAKCAAGYTLKIARQMSYTQPLSFRTQGYPSAYAQELAHDRTTMLIQQLAYGGASASPSVLLQTGTPTAQTGTLSVLGSGGAASSIVGSDSVHSNASVVVTSYDGVNGAQAKLMGSGGDDHIYVGGGVEIQGQVGNVLIDTLDDHDVILEAGGAGGIDLIEGGGGVNISGPAGLSISGGGGIATSGRISQLGTTGTATVGPGVAPIYGAYSSSADETASKGDTTLLATATQPISPGAGLYRVVVYAMSNATCATPGPGAVTVGVKWTDPTGSQKTLAAMPMDVNGGATLATSLPLGNLTGWANATFPLYANASTSIIFNTTLTACTSGTAKYRVFVTLEKLS